MKLATLKHGRDGQLVVVSRDLRLAADASAMAPNMQWALDHWDSVESALLDLADQLEAGRVPTAIAFDPQQAAAPLPRAYQWLDASAFTSHGDLMRQALALAENPQRPGIPLMYQGGSDTLLGAQEDVPFASEELGIDFEGEFAVVLGDTPMGVTRDEAHKYIRLIGVANDWSLRSLAGVEMKTGFGWLQAKPSTSFSPVMVTPDELGEAWDQGRVHLPLLVEWNAKPFGKPSGSAMTFDFNHLVEHAAATRRLAAGTILGSGTVSEGAPDRVGSACITEQRGFEILNEGQIRTGYMKFGDRVRMDVRDQHGSSIFGAIDQKIVPASIPPAEV